MVTKIILQNHQIIMGKSQIIIMLLITIQLHQDKFLIQILHHNQPFKHPEYIITILLPQIKIFQGFITNLKVKLKTK